MSPATSSVRSPLSALMFKFVPSLLILPSNPVPNKICPLSIMLKSCANLALPPSDISRVSALKLLPPSFPRKIMSESCFTACT